MSQNIKLLTTITKIDDMSEDMSEKIIDLMSDRFRKYENPDIKIQEHMRVSNEMMPNKHDVLIIISGFYGG